MKRKNAGIVRLSEHAFERWQLRVSANTKRGRVREIVRSRLQTELRLGAEVGKYGALWVEVGPCVWAVCYPSLMGGWVVATIIREGWMGDMEERARYGGDREEERESRLDKAEYEITQNVLLNQAGMISMLPLEAFLNTLRHAKEIVPFVDPTLFIKTTYGQGADNVQAIQEIAETALKMKKAVLAYREKYAGEEAGSL